MILITQQGVKNKMKRFCNECKKETSHHFNELVDRYVCISCFLKQIPAIELEERFFEPNQDYTFKKYTTFYTKESVQSKMAELKSKILTLEAEREILLTKIIKAQEALMLH